METSGTETSGTGSSGTGSSGTGPSGTEPTGTETSGKAGGGQPGRWQRVLTISVTVAVCSAFTYFYQYWTSASVTCSPGPSVRCEATLSAFHRKAFRVCWSLQATCKNGRSARGQGCGVVREAQPASVSFEAAALEPRGACDEAASVTAEVTEKQRLVL